MLSPTTARAFERRSPRRRWARFAVPLVSPLVSTRARGSLTSDDDDDDDDDDDTRRRTLGRARVSSGTIDES